MRGKQKLRNFTLLLMVVIMVLAIPKMFSSSRAEKTTETFIPTEVEYSENKEKATISFLMEEINKELYEITKITEKNEQKVLYDKATGTQEPVVYETDKNGDYTFIVDYIEKVEIPAAETPAEEEQGGQEVQQPVEPEEQPAEEVPATLEEPADGNAENPNEEQPVTDEETEADKEAPQETGTEEIAAPVTEGQPAEEETPVTLEEPVTPKAEEPAETIPPAEEETPAEPQYEYVEKQVEMTVTIDGIVLPEQNEDTSEDITDEEDLSDDINEDNIAPDYPQGYDDAGNGESVNLNDQFNASGIMQKHLTTITKPLTDNAYSVSGNQIRLGDKNDEYKNQTVAVTSKYQMDMRRSFEIKGSMNKNAGPDGFAVSLHTGSGYQAKNVNGSLGIYKDSYMNTDARNNGIPQGYAFEIDTWNNPRAHNNASVAGYDDFYNGADGTYYHMAATKTDANGTIISNNGNKGHTKYALLNSGDFSSNQPFSLEWKPTYNANSNTITGGTFTFKFGSKTVTNTLNSSDQSHLNNFVTKGGAYITFSASLNYASNGVKPDDINITVDRVAYTDFDPVFKTTVDARVDANNKQYAVPGESITITHEMYNNNANGGIPFDTKTKLAMTQFSLINPSMGLTIDGDIMVKRGENGTWTKYTDYGGKFNTSTPMYPPILKGNEKYYVQYHVKIPENAIGSGSSNIFRWKYLAGEEGMTQYTFTGDVNVYALPELYSEVDGQKHSDYDVISLNTTDAAEAKLWENLYGKVSSGSNTNPQQLSLNGSYTGFTISYKYKKNLTGEGTTVFPQGIQKGDIISLHLTITDTSTQATNTFVRYLLLSDNANTTDPGTDSGGSKYYAFANNLSSVTETKLVTYTEEEYKGKVSTEAAPKALKIETNGNASIITTGFTLPDLADYINGSLGPDPIGHDIKIKFTDANATEATVNVKQPVTANTWDYDDSGKTIEDGAVGFIIIPKHVSLDKNGTGSAEIKLSEYTNANKVKYDVSTEPSFELTNQNANKQSLTINVTPPQSNTVSLGQSITFNFAMKPEDLKAIEDTKEKSEWHGSVIFSFVRGTR